MTVDRAVAILRRGVQDHLKREIRRPELYDALNLLEQYLDKKNWLVRRYGNALRGDTRNTREKMAQQESLRIRFRGIQQACAEKTLVEINELALHYRESKPAIDKLRRQLAAIGHTIQRRGL